MSQPDQVAMRSPDRLVVVGASAGGVQALSTLMSGFEPGLPAAILVVLHLPASSHSVLPEILARAGALPAAHPRDREPLVAGQVYVAAPDRHLLVGDGVVRVTRGAWENGYRPSIDALFRSAARWYGSHAIGVVLSGALDDGAAGLASIATNGGVTFVQEPGDAAVPDMPANALGMVPDAHVLPVNRLAGAIDEALAMNPPRLAIVADDPASVQVVTDELDEYAAQGAALSPEDAGKAPAGLVCPDCAGSLFVLEDDPVPRFRCRVGHGWTAEALTGSHGRQLEQALWAAVQIIEEDQSVQRRLLARAENAGRESAVQRMKHRAHHRDALVRTLRAAIDDLEPAAAAVAAGATPDERVLEH